MTSFRLAALAAFAITGGLLIALVTTGDARVISTQVWLGTTLTIATLVTVALLFPAHRNRGQRATALVRRRRPTSKQPTARPKDLVAAERTIIVSLGDVRAFENQLRPRLRQLLDTHDQIGARRETNIHARSTQWLVDDTPAPRPPTIDELRTFIDLLTANGTSNE